MIRKIVFYTFYISVFVFLFMTSKSIIDVISWNKYNLYERYRSPRIHKIENISFNLQRISKRVTWNRPKLFVNKELIALKKEYQVELKDLLILDLNDLEEIQVVANRRNENSFEQLSLIPNLKISLEKINTDPIEIEGFEEKFVEWSYKPANEDFVTSKMASVVSTENFKNDEEDLEYLMAQAKRKVKSKTNSNNDELVMIEVGKQDVEQPQKSEKSNISQLVNSQLSSNVQEVIEREIEKEIKNRSVTYHTKSPINKLSQPPSYDTSSGFLENKKNERNEKQIITRIIADQVDLNKSSKGKVYQAQFIPSYNNNEVYSDSGEGIIEYSQKHVVKNKNIKGLLIRNGFMRTRVNIDLTKSINEIPLISQESMDKFITTNQLIGYEGFVLVSAFEIDDVEIDVGYKFRIFLDENYRKVSQDADYKYIFFAGVRPGNIMLKGLTFGGKQVEKLSFATPDEITYENWMIRKRPSKELVIRSLEVMSNENPYLDIEEQLISDFYTMKKLEKVGIGVYKLDSEEKVKSSRSYLEFKHLSSPIYLGLNDDQKVISVPSEEYISNSLRMFDLDELRKMCVVQINLESPVKKIDVTFETSRGYSNYDLRTISKDGSISSKIEPDSKVILLLGEEQGTFNIGLKNYKNEIDFIETYCSDTTYLVEQL